MSLRAHLRPLNVVIVFTSHLRVRCARAGFGLFLVRRRSLSLILAGRASAPIFTLRAPPRAREGVAFSRSRVLSLASSLSLSLYLGLHYRVIRAGTASAPTTAI